MVNKQIEQRRERGVCLTCALVSPVEGHVLCQYCMDRARILQKERVAQRKSEGLCTRCGKYPKRATRNICLKCSAVKKCRVCEKRCELSSKYCNKCLLNKIDRMMER